MRAHKTLIQPRCSAQGDESMIKKKKPFSIIWQVAILFVLATLLVGSITYFSQHAYFNKYIKDQTAGRAASITKEVDLAVKQYPAYEWLLKYWYEHADELDVEYDTDYRASTETEQKCWLMEIHQPNLQLRYANTSEIEALPEEDQKLYAEILYSWLITRLNEIKRSHQVDFLFTVISEEPYDKQCFLLSAADPGAKRGMNYEEVYPIGTEADVITEYTQEAMRECVKSREGYLADANKYMDYYAYLGEFDGHQVMTGVTYDLSAIKASVQAQTWKSTAFVMLYLLGLALICLQMIYWFVIRPLKTVQKNIHVYESTKSSTIVETRLNEIKARNEIGQLKDDVIGLTKEIDDYINRISAITAEKERIGAELSVANRIQTAMLPSIFPPFPGRSEFDIYASMDPAKEVGGDFYDFFLIDDDHLCLIIADVSGKGVPAALFMMACKIIFENYAMMGKSPAQILIDANAAITANNQEDMFVTAWVGILEISTGTLTTANAGHEYPAFKKPGGAYELFKDKHGFIIGGIENVQYQEDKIHLEAGSKVFVYTDGLAEATNGQQKLFGTDRMLIELNKVPDVGARKTLEHMTTAVLEYVGDAEQFDDLTMMCLEYNGLTTN